MDKSLEPKSPFGEALWDVLGRYVSGESTSTEAEVVRHWLAEDPRREQLLATLNRAAAGLVLVPPDRQESQAAWRKFAARLDEPDVRPIPLRSPRASAWLRAAAVVALVAGSAVVWRALSQREKVQQPTPAIASARTFTTQVGQADSIALPDGSKVVLGPASRLTLASGYGSGQRDVELSGEALFDVVHDPANPFTVKVASVTIKDLGTVFAVRDDGGEIRVVVTAGSVLLQSGGSPGVELKAGDRGLATPGRVATAERAAATPDDVAWTRGQLIYRGAAMSVVKADLRRWYGIELQITDSTLAGRHLTASFAHEPADRVLRMLGLALGASIEHRGDTAIVRP